MNLNNLLNTNPEYKEGNLPIALYRNNMQASKGNTESYYARIISRGTCTIEDLANDLVLAKNDFGLSTSQLVAIAQAFNAAKLARISEGFTVNDGIARTSAKIEGSFLSENDTFDASRHKVSLVVSPVAKAKSQFSQLRPVIRQGNSSHPTIMAVYDLESQGGAILSKGGFLEITGTKIMIIGDHGDVGLYFENVDEPDKTVKLTADKLGTNTSTRLACVVPATLEAGNYKVRVTTQFLTSKTQRKEPQSYTFNTIFTVV